MPKLPPTLNLSDLAAQLTVSGLFPEVRHKINQVIVVQSCLGDLREAQDCFDALQKLLKSVRGWKSKERDSTEAALLSTSVHLYARATVTNTNRRSSGQTPERGPSQIHDALTPELRADHDALVDIRSQALAHVYFDRSIGGERWHSAAAVAIHTDKGWLMGAASRRVSLERESVARLGRLLPKAIELMMARSQQRFSELNAAIEKASSPELDALLSKCWLDPVGFFGSEEAAEIALGRVQAGSWTMFEGHN